MFFFLRFLIELKDVDICLNFFSFLADNVKAVLTIGGWKGSHYFSALVSNDYSRGVFATAIANYLTTTG